MSKIIFGPALLEMGWEVATYIPACRHIAQNYKQRIVICKPGTQYLYSDFADIYHLYNKEGRSDRWLFRDKKIKIPDKYKKLYPDAVKSPPDRRMCLHTPRKYLHYGKLNKKLKYDLVIHARSEAKYGRSNRNWTIGKYMKVVTALREIKHLSVCSIGSVKGAYYIPGTNDMRGVGMKILCDLLASSKLCIGVSSGPLHLASFCGCPHLVWTGNERQKAIGGTNKDRYERIWNPFNTKVKVINKYGWTPPWEIILKAVRDRI